MRLAHLIGFYNVISMRTHTGRHQGWLALIHLGSIFLEVMYVCPVLHMIRLFFNVKHEYNNNIKCFESPVGGRK